MSTPSREGLVRCWEAFERLKAGTAKVAAHIGLPATRITAGIVSVEAGFDRGYLKKDRAGDRELIAAIKIYRDQANTKLPDILLQIKILEEKLDREVVEHNVSRDVLYKVVAQNLQLIERIRTLENKLSISGNMKSM